MGIFGKCNYPESKCPDNEVTAAKEASSSYNWIRVKATEVKPGDILRGMVTHDGSGTFGNDQPRRVLGTRVEPYVHLTLESDKWAHGTSSGMPGHSIVEIDPAPADGALTRFTKDELLDELKRR